MDRPRLATRLGLFVLAAFLAMPSGAEEKLILLDDVPRDLARFTVAPDGSRLYFAGRKYLVFDASGVLKDQIGVPEGSSPRDLIPLPDGWFLACDSYANGHIALCRPDGTEAKVLVKKGGDEATLRADVTGWTSPVAAAVDVRARRIFVLDTTAAPRDTPDPDFSRIAVFDFDGKYVGEINRYDAKARDPDARRTWYADIEVDPDRGRVYVVARRTKEVLAFSYDGKPLGRVKAPSADEYGGLAVFPDGRVAVGSDHIIQIYDTSLRPDRQFDVTNLAPDGGIGDLEADGSGRLYASITDPSITFLRLSPDLTTTEVVGPRYRRVAVDFPAGAIEAGKTFALKVRVTGRPEPGSREGWQVMARPADGTDLRWRPLPAAPERFGLLVASPGDLRGLYEVAVRFGAGPIDWGDREDDPSIRKTLAFVPKGAVRSLSVVTESGRTAFRQGEPIALHLVRRAEGLAAVPVRIDLTRAETVLASVEVRVGRNEAGAVPPTLTLRLTPGRYQLVPSARGHESYPLTFDIAPAEPDSPLQRILYHEFAQGATERQEALADTAERLDFIRNSARAAADLGFTRETDRKLGKIDKDGPRGWRRDRSPADLSPPGLAPAESHGIPTMDADWEAESYLDQAVRFGLRYDSQLLGHCAGVRFRESWLRELTPILQRGAQWFGRYPSFYGFNYNDEMFFGGFAADWTQEDKDWLARVEREKFPGRPHTDTLEYAIRVMYDRFNAAVRQVDPKARLTATPMWQFPAVEGSYAPTIYRGMDESYSHFLSEGYLLPWYPAHSVEFVRRPGLPLMGVFDNGHRGDGGDVYLKNLMQVVARGVQGVGTEHLLPFDDPRGADAYRTANLLARLYGPVFAGAPPANEAAVLYSRSQDITETRNSMGTPHWERVYAIVGAGLMAGVPMGITYEEDVASGVLLDGETPRVPMLFLVGQTVPLPKKVDDAIAAYRKAGGRVFTDAESAAHPGAKRLGFPTHVLRSALHEGYAADSIYPIMQPILERLARDLAGAVATHRRFPMDTDDLWVSKNQFDGGAIRYLMLASETSPYPWDAGTVWSLGTLYNRSYLPKSVALRFPARPGVVYDVFDHTLVTPRVVGGTASLPVDLTTFPGRLYALAPTRLGAPEVSAQVGAGTVRFEVRIVGNDGKPIRARVPVRVRLTNGAVAAQEVVRGTDADGTLAASLPLPAYPRRWTLEATELLGGEGSAVVLEGGPARAELIVARPDVEPRREAQLRGLLREAKGGMTLVTAREDVLTEAQKSILKAALGRAEIALRTDVRMPKEITPGIYLSAGYLDGLYNRPGDFAGDPIWESWQRGLFDVAVSGSVPGAGRGLFTPVFAPRGDREHAVVLLGGDADGLARTVTAFVRWLDAPPSESKTPAEEFSPSIAGKSADIAPVPDLRDLVGVKLSGVTVAEDGRHLVVTADGYCRNLALVEDLGARARVLRTARVGQAPEVGSAYVSPDGALFGASGREVARFGEGFHLIDARDGSEEVFAAFGDVGRQHHRFAATSRGDVVIAPGAYGVVCWRREGKMWKEAWALDYWKTFRDLDWPVSAEDERLPEFHAVIPRGADHALIAFGETSPTGWITPENPSAAWLAELSLADGKVRRQFAAPIPKTQLFPTLQTSPDGSRVLLRVQMGSWGKETFRFFPLDGLKARSSWDATTEPIAAAIADPTGNSAHAFKGRLLESRRADGALVSSQLWYTQPIGLAFADDGLGLFVADQAGRLTRLDARGNPVWRIAMGRVASLAARGDRVYAACWDGRLRAFGSDGKPLWVLDLTPDLRDDQPLKGLVASAAIDPRSLHQARRPATTSAAVPEGANLLRNGKATLTVGGTPGWMSEGKVQVVADDLTNGRRDDVASPWLHIDELFWDGQAGRQVWAEVAFKEPTDLRALTVHENPEFPDSWPTEGLVQVWDESQKRWETAARGLFLAGPTNTYRLDLTRVSRLRYLPWNRYYRNFHTSEIEVR